MVPIKTKDEPMNLYIGIHPDDENILTLTDFNGKRVLVFEKDFSNARTAKTMREALLMREFLERFSNFKGRYDNGTMQGEKMDDADYRFNVQNFIEESRKLVAKMSGGTF